MSGELTERLGLLLHRLPREQREVLVLRIAVGMSVEGTAAAVGSTPDAVRVTQHRALNQLRAMVLDTDQATGRAPDGQRVAAGGGAGEQEQGAVAACGEDQGRHCGSD